METIFWVVVCTEIVLIGLYIIRFSLSKEKANEKKIRTRLGLLWCLLFNFRLKVEKGVAGPPVYMNSGFWKVRYGCFVHSSNNYLATEMHWWRFMWILLSTPKEKSLNMVLRNSFDRVPWFNSYADRTTMKLFSIGLPVI